MIKKILVGIIALASAVLFSAPALAVTTQVINGGTGSTTLSGILIGAAKLPIKTLTIGSGLTLTGTTLSASGGVSASSTLLIDANTFSGVNKFTNASSDFSGTWQTFSPAHFQVAGSYLTAALTGLKQTFGATQTGATQTLATSSDTNIGLTITTGTDTHTFTPTWIGTLADARISSAATWNAKLSAVVADSPLSGSGTSGSHLTISTAGTWSGLAGTATALAANGTNCSAGNYPLGVDASGNSESCTAAPVGTVTGVTATYPLSSSGGATPNITTALGTTTNSGMAAGSLYVGSGGIWQTAASTSIFGYLPLNPTRNLTVAGTANQITLTGGTQDLSADRTWTATLPAHVIFPGNFQVTNSTTTNATTTSFAVLGSTTLGTQLNGAGLSSCTGGTNALTWSVGVFGCQSISASGSVYPFPLISTQFGATANATSSIVAFNSGIQASSTSQFSNSTTTLATIGSLYLGANGLVNSLTGSGLSISGNALTIGSGAITDGMLASTFVKSLTVTTGQGVTGTFSAGATPALALTLGALTGVTSFNGLVVTANTGTITTGVWNGTAIAIANGGTNATSFGTSGGITAYDGTRLVNFSGYTLTSLVLTAANASTTNFTASQSLGIPNSSNPSPTFSGGITQSTNAPYQIHIGNNAAGTTIFDPRVAFTFGIATTTAWTGSVTAPSVTIPTALTWTQISCTVQPAGATLTAQYQYANPAAYTTVNITSIPASTTPGVYTLSSNNTPTANATSTITFSSPAGSPTSVSCTLIGTVGGI